MASVATVKATRQTLNGQARVFLHEAAHCNYFIDGDGTVPFVDDLTFTHREGGQRVATEGYGPENCRNLTNYIRMCKGGFYTQRNGKFPVFCKSQCGPVANMAMKEICWTRFG